MCASHELAFYLCMLAGDEMCRAAQTNTDWRAFSDVEALFKKWKELFEGGKKT